MPKLTRSPTSLGELRPKQYSTPQDMSLPRAALDQWVEGPHIDDAPTEPPAVLAVPRTAPVLGAPSVRPAPPAGTVSEELTGVFRPEAVDVKLQRWGEAFIWFWNKATARLGVPFSPLMQALCDWAIDHKHASTLDWLIEEIDAPLTEPEDEDEQGPSKGNPLQRIAAGLAQWEPAAAIPVWRSLLTCIENITDDPYDVEYSLKVVLRELCYLQDAAGRAQIADRARSIIACRLGGTPDLQLSAQQRLTEAENRVPLPKPAHSVHPAALPPVPSTLSSPCAIRAFVQEVPSMEPANQPQRIESLCVAFIAALRLTDTGLFAEITSALLDATNDPIAQLRVLDRVSYLVLSANPALRDAYVETLFERLLNAPRSYWDGFLRALGIVMPDDAQASHRLAQQLFPFITAQTQGGAPGQMEVWCALARKGHLTPIVEDLQRLPNRSH